MIPSGSKTVYTDAKGAVTEPYLHVKYRANDVTNRKFKITVTGAEAGNSRVDELVVDFLTERMLNVLGRNNCFIFQG